MNRGKLTRIIPIALIAIIVIVAVAALISFGRTIFNGGQKAPLQTDTSQQDLLDTSDGKGVSMIVRGPIVADENFRSYQIVITNNQRTLTTYKGYLKTPLKSISLNNNTVAYREFVNALDRANLMKGTPLAGAKDATDGICASGRVYDFQLTSGALAGKHLWTSTCGGSKGSLNASLTQLVGLFQAQIPDANQTISQLDLTSAVY